ncbi:MAG: flagellin domain protein [Firmicutes bacterium]|nr:flagellin domain protein [Bacillota bacterium]
MSMVISTNMSALNTTNQLNKNSALMNSSLEKLSSGYSINSAADNAAGLAISEKMRAQIEGLDQASSNSQDAISLTQTADGALDETTSILKRMRELAVQASSDTLTDDDRQSIQDEVDQLRQEIDRISNDTEFNTKKLLNGDSGSSTAVSGTNSSAIIASTTTAGNNTEAGSYTVEYTAVATQATTGANITSSTGITSTTGLNTDASSFAGDVSINGTTITIESGDTIQGVIDKINAESDTTGVTAELDATDTSNEFIKLTDSTYGSASEITLAADNSTLRSLFNATADTDVTSVTVNGTDAAGTINGAIASAIGNTLTAFDLTVTGDNETLAGLGETTNTAASAAYTTLNTVISTTSDANVTSAQATYDTALTGSSDSAVVTAKAAYDAAAAGTGGSIAASAIVTGTSATAATDMSSVTGNSLTITVDGNDYSLSNADLVSLGSGATGTSLAAAINTKLGSNGTASIDGSGNLVITSASTGASSSVSVTATGAAVQGLSGYTATATTDTGADAVAATVDTTDVANAYATLTSAIANTTDEDVTAAQTTYDHVLETSTDTAVVAAKNTYNNATVAATATVTVDTSSALTFQIGANSGQTMTLSIGDMDANALGVNGDSSTTGIDLSTVDAATSALTTIDSAISKVSAARSNLGAVQNSLESNINNLDTESENLTSAESNIRDTDMASEMAEYTKLSVITQAATAMLAKANQQPQQVLTLLQG